MHTETTEAEREAVALRETKKVARRIAMVEFKRLHAVDPEKAREEARLWFERQALPADAETMGQSAFHQRKLDEADPARKCKAAEAVRKIDEGAGKAQNASRETVKQWRKRNPNKVKKLGKLYRERQKS